MVVVVEFGSTVVVVVVVVGSVVVVVVVGAVVVVVVVVGLAVVVVVVAFGSAVVVVVTGSVCVYASAQIVLSETTINEPPIPEAPPSDPAVAPILYGLIANPVLYVRVVPLKYHVVTASNALYCSIVLAEFGPNSRVKENSVWSYVNVQLLHFLPVSASSNVPIRGSDAGS